MIRMFRIVVTLLGLGLPAIAQVSSSAESTPEPASQAASQATERDFDFLVGTWEFTAHAQIPGAPPQYSGIWTAKRTGDETVVEDAYKVVDNTGTRRYLGVTYRAFDGRKKVWTTAFVQPPGATWSLGTAWRHGDEIWEGPLDDSKAKRARFYDIEPDHFRWIAERSTDGGKSWSNYVRVEARRVPVK